MAGLNPREEAACWAEECYAGARAAVGQGLIVAADLWVTCPAVLWDTVYQSALETLVQMPPDEREFHLADTLQSCAVVGRPALSTVVDATQAMRHWAADGRTRAPATYLILQRLAVILQAQLVVHLDNGGHSVFSTLEPMFTIHLGCANRHYELMSVTEVSALVNSSAPHSGLLAGLGSEVAVLALSYVHRYMEEQRQEVHNNVYYPLVLDERCVEKRWQELQEHHEELLEWQEEQLACGYDFPYGMYREIIMLGIDCHTMLKESDDLENTVDLMQDDMFLQRLHAFYVCFAIGLPNPQGSMSDAAFFNTTHGV